MFKKTLALLVIGTGLCSFQPSQAVSKNLLNRIVREIPDAIVTLMPLWPIIKYKQKDYIAQASLVSFGYLIKCWAIQDIILGKKDDYGLTLGLRGMCECFSCWMNIALLGNQHHSRPTFWTLSGSALWNGFYGFKHLIKPLIIDKLVEKYKNNSTYYCKQSSITDIKNYLVDFRNLITLKNNFPDASVEKNKQLHESIKKSISEFNNLFNCPSFDPYSNQNNDSKKWVLVIEEWAKDKNLKTIKEQYSSFQTICSTLEPACREFIEQKRFIIKPLKKIIDTINEVLTSDAFETINTLFKPFNMIVTSEKPILDVSAIDIWTQDKDLATIQREVTKTVTNLDKFLTGNNSAAAGMKKIEAIDKIKKMISDINCLLRNFDTAVNWGYIHGTKKQVYTVINDACKPFNISVTENQTSIDTKAIDEWAADKDLETIQKQVKESTEFYEKAKETL